MPHRFALFILLTALSSASCFTHHTIPAEEMNPLRRADQRREIVLRDKDRARVRVTPRSRIRVQIDGGHYTRWMSATDLRLRPEGLVAGDVVLHWEEIHGLEVNDFDLGRTIIGTAGGTTVIVLAAVAESLVIGGIAAATGGRVQISQIGLTSATVDAVVDLATSTHLDDAPLVLAPAAPEPELALRSRPLFAGAARRRSIVRASIASEAGVGWAEVGAHAESGVTGAFRLFGSLELGAGLRYQHRPIGDPAPSGISPFIRCGLHLDLDAARRIALPALVEIGVGRSTVSDVRLVWGVRIRLSDKLQLGIHPFTPIVYSAAPTHVSTRVSTIDLAALF